MNNPSERREWMGEQEMTELNKRGLSAGTMKAGEEKGEVGGRGGDGLENRQTHSGGNVPHCEGRRKVLHLRMDLHQE